MAIPKELQIQIKENIANGEREIIELKKDIKQAKSAGINVVDEERKLLELETQIQKLKNQYL